MNIPDPANPEKTGPQHGKGNVFLLLFADLLSVRLRVFLHVEI